MTAGLIEFQSCSPEGAQRDPGGATRITLRSIPATTASAWEPHGYCLPGHAMPDSKRGAAPSAAPMPLSMNARQTPPSSLNRGRSSRVAFRQIGVLMAHLRRSPNKASA